MDKFIIQGGNALHGSLTVYGAKNHALKAFASSLLSVQPMDILNVPEIEDIHRLTEILKEAGAVVDHIGPHHYRIDTSKVTRTALSQTGVPKLRASIVLSGPMLARFGAVSFPHPGGCDFGRRPIDLFVKGFEAMGATYEERDGRNIFTTSGRLHGAHFVFPKISVTCTETLLMAATLAEGTTVLENAACEPEIVALANYLISQGAKITGAGTRTITIEGVESLSAGTQAIIPDRIEAISFLALALATKSELTINQVDPGTLTTPLRMLSEAGASIDVKADALVVHPWETLKPIQIATQEYPGFPTDGQSPFTVLLTQIPGKSEVKENIYSNRLFFTDMLNRMGADIHMHTPQHISVQGATSLRAKKVESPDLRAGIAMVIAGCVAKGATEIGNIYQIDRGYEAIDERLRGIGVDIRRLA